MGEGLERGKVRDRLVGVVSDETSTLFLGGHQSDYNVCCAMRGRLQRFARSVRGSVGWTVLASVEGEQG